MVLAFTSVSGTLRHLDDCEMACHDWDIGLSRDENHEQAVHDLAQAIGTSVGYTLTEQETDVTGLRKYLVE
jgi:hypothetical protein